MCPILPYGSLLSTTFETQTGSGTNQQRTALHEKELIPVKWISVLTLLWGSKPYVLGTENGNLSMKVLLKLDRNMARNWK